MSRKVDRLQSLYGVPNPKKSKFMESVLPSEFAAKWENLMCFRHNVLKPPIVQNTVVRSKPAPYKSKLKRQAVICGSRPIKWGNKRSKKPKVFQIPNFQIQNAQIPNCQILNL